MTPGFIYALSNPCLNGLLKIGLTEISPETRSRALSRSSAIPTDFKLEHSVRVDDVKTAETWTHLLLATKRYREGKEFFAISLEEAVGTIDAVAAFMRGRKGISPEIGIHDAEILSFSSQRLSIFDMKILRFLMYATENNGADLPVGTPRTGIVDGFVSAGQVAGFLCTTEAQARRHMAAFWKDHADLEKGIDLVGTMLGWRTSIESRVDIKVFDELHYHKGHMAWIFSPHYRSLFKTHGEQHM